MKKLNKNQLKNVTGGGNELPGSKPNPGPLMIALWNGCMGRVGPNGIVECWNCPEGRICWT